MEPISGFNASNYALNLSSKPDVGDAVIVAPEITTEPLQAAESVDED